jgi:hypothetical protein
MSEKQIGLSLVLVGFTALTALAVYEYGYIGFFEVELSSLPGVTVFVDLVIALSLVLAWMWRDARERGMSVLPYVALTLTLGSVGPLLYLIRREGRLAQRDGAPVRVAA